MLDNNNKQLKIGHVVCYTHKMSSYIYFSRVVGFTNQMVKLYDGNYTSKKYPRHLIIINPKYMKDLDIEIKQ